MQKIYEALRLRHDCKYVRIRVGEWVAGGARLVELPVGETKSLFHSFTAVGSARSITLSAMASRTGRFVAIPAALLQCGYKRGNKHLYACIISLITSV